LREDFVLIMNYRWILDFGMRILDLRYSVYIINRMERSDTADPKSQI
jgi:hypothetical protein